MKKQSLIAAALLAGGLGTGAQTMFSVTLDDVDNGTLQVEPVVPADGKVKDGTVFTVTAVPDEGYALDSVYYSAPGIWGTMYYESMDSPYEVVIDEDKHLGASFIETSEVDGLKVIQNVVYAQPGVKPLRYDVFSPEGAEKLPCIVIIHGGGWVSNTEDVMRGLARELARNGKYVVCSIDYRWAGRRDGDETDNTMADIIGDVFGAIAHIMEHAEEYGADPSRIAVTGDSAGGHLSAVAATMGDMIGDGGFGKTPGVFEFMPTYLPAGKSVEQVRAEIMAAVQAAAPSYGVFSPNHLNHFSDDPAADAEWTKAIAPLNHIPPATDRAVPHYLTRGSADSLIKDEMVRDYMNALVQAGQRAEYVQVGGAGHAFFDWKPDEKTKATFRRYGMHYAREMELFFDSVFYPD